MVTVTLREILLPSMNCHETGSKFKKIKIKFFFFSSYLLPAEYKAQPKKEAFTSALISGECIKSQILGKMLSHSLGYRLFSFYLIWYFIFLWDFHTIYFNKPHYFSQVLLGLPFPFPPLPKLYHKKKKTTNPSRQICAAHVFMGARSSTGV